MGTREPGPGTGGSGQATEIMASREYDADDCRPREVLARAAAQPNRRTDGFGRPAAPPRPHTPPSPTASPRPPHRRKIWCWSGGEGIRCTALGGTEQPAAGSSRRPRIVETDFWECTYARVRHVRVRTHKDARVRTHIHRSRPRRELLAEADEDGGDRRLLVHERVRTRTYAHAETCSPRLTRKAESDCEGGCAAASSAMPRSVSRGRLSRAKAASQYSSSRQRSRSHLAWHSAGMLFVATTMTRIREQQVAVRVRCRAVERQAPGRAGTGMACVMVAVCVVTTEPTPTPTPTPTTKISRKRMSQRELRVANVAPNRRETDLRSSSQPVLVAHSHHGDDSDDETPTTPWPGNGRLLRPVGHAT